MDSVHPFDLRGGLRCTGYWRGDTLMRVDPAGPFYPIYERQPDLPPVDPGLPAGTPISSI